MREESEGARCEHCGSWFTAGFCPQIAKQKICYCTFNALPLHWSSISVMSQNRLTLWLKKCHVSGVFFCCYFGELIL